MQFYKNQQDHFFVQLDDGEFDHEDLAHVTVDNHQGDETKHQPVISYEGNQVKVKIGDIMHPMTPEHHISMIFLKTEQGGQYKIFKDLKTPITCFQLSDDDKPLEVYGYCNLHGLWKETF